LGHTTITLFYILCNICYLMFKFQFFKFINLIT